MGSKDGASVARARVRVRVRIRVRVRVRVRVRSEQPAVPPPAAHEPTEGSSAGDSLR